MTYIERLYFAFYNYFFMFTQNTKQLDAFYSKKRALFRKIDEFAGSQDCEVFMIIHNKKSDRSFSYTSDTYYTLEKISELVLKEAKQAQMWDKLSKFMNTDFSLVAKNMAQTKAIRNQTGSISTLKDVQADILKHDWSSQGKQRSPLKP